MRECLYACLSVYLRFIRIDERITRTNKITCSFCMRLWMYIYKLVRHVCMYVCVCARVCVRACICVCVCYELEREKIIFSV